MNVFAQSHCNNKWDITSTAFPPGASSVLEEIPELFLSNLLCAGTGRGGDKACVGDSGSPLMVFDTTTTPPTWVHIGLVHGGVVCSDFYKNLDFPEIFSRTEDAEGVEKNTCTKGRLRPDPWCATKVDDSGSYIT